MMVQKILRGACLVFAGAAFPATLNAQPNPSALEVAAFLTADADQNQVLTFDEFTVFVRLMAREGQPTARTIRFWGAYRYAFALADANMDGNLDPQELANGNQNHMSGR